MKIVTVVGARPQFIKASPVSRALALANVDEVLVHTGQHYDSNMSDQFFEELAIPRPAVNLGVGSGSHASQTAAMLTGIERVIEQEQPSWVLVYGDTNSTIAAALAASKLHVPIAHVEAGLRSFNRRMPEEVNRIVTDVLSTLLFAPTAGAAEHLHSEGIPRDRVNVVGDVMYDAVLAFADAAKTRSRILENLGVVPGGYILATIHRAENTDDDDRLRLLCSALEIVAQTHPVVLPLHPRTRQRLDALGLLESLDRQLRLIPPVGYLDMISLEMSAALIATDSGGVQKEAFFFEVPCVTLRRETEWSELIELRWNQLSVGTSAPVVAQEILNALGRRGEVASPYGDGNAAGRIAAALKNAN